MFKGINSLREKENYKYDEVEKEIFNKGLILLKRIDRELRTFKHEHKIFQAKFIFNGTD